MLKFKPNKRTVPKLLINIGACLDIPTSSLIKGAKGETIINGGLGLITGIVGAGNNYKSTITHYMMLSAADKVAATEETAMATYDTEVNISLDRLEHLASRFDNIPDNPIVSDDAIWSVTDKSLESANSWAVSLNSYINEKSKDTKLLREFTAFTDPYTKKPMKATLPTFIEIDSLTEFEPDSTVEMLTKDLDSSDTNTFALKQGLFKTKFLSQLPTLGNSSNTNFLLTAHIGEKIDMSSGPAKYNQPTRKLQYLKTSDNIKGVTSKFLFLLNNSWFTHAATLLKNPTTKLAEYPLNNKETATTDLNTVKLTQLRSKSGPSGYTLEIIVSQVEGVLPTLTEFHYIKNNDKIGISGSNTNYVMDLLPDVKLSRMNIRSKIDDIANLRRAINITSEMIQLARFHQWTVTQGYMCTPKELYDDLIAMGYDWEVLLNTRGYWLIDNYNKDQLPFLSTIDLLRMRKGEYTPYWYKKESKS